MMEDANKYSNFLTAIIPSVIDTIATKNNLTVDEATQKFYHSKLYEELSDPASELWHYGPAMLNYMFAQEMETGHYDYPEGT